MPAPVTLGRSGSVATPSGPYPLHFRLVSFHRGLKQRRFVGVVPRGRSCFFTYLSKRFIFRRVESLATNRGEPPAGRVVDHIGSFPRLQPVVVTRVPTAPTRQTGCGAAASYAPSPRAASRTPQFALDHPSPHRLPTHLEAVFLSQVFRRQRRPNPRYTGRDRMPIASCAVSSPILRCDGTPRSAYATALSPTALARSSRRTCRSVIPNFSAAYFCVTSFFFAFFSTVDLHKPNGTA